MVDVFLINSLPLRVVRRSLLLLSVWLMLPWCHAESVDDEVWNAKAQATYVWQGKQPFLAAYSGSNSLRADQERSYSFTATAMLGWRPAASHEVYFNPEVAQGVPLSNLTGLGGFTNGEIARSSGPNLKLYRARLFWRKTWNQGGGGVDIESAPNQLGGRVESRRWVLTAGNFSVLDVFDGNAYSHDPRTQFLNWSLMTHGAYDYAADARGYSRGVALEWYHDDWAMRAGRFIQPWEPNQQALDPHVFRHFGDQVEVEHAHALSGLAGKVRLLAFRNRTKMAKYQDAMDFAVQAGGVPSLGNVRSGDQIKWGVGLNVEQALSDTVGVFGRASWADGKTETYAFTEIDRSISTGMLVKGGAWGRVHDSMGVAVARNGLSSIHRTYLAAGGLGFFVGDGRLNYRPEAVFEAFYSLGLTKAAWLTFDAQRIANPGYNASRGPVNVVSARLHAEF